MSQEQVLVITVVLVDICAPESEPPKVKLYGMEIGLVADVAHKPQTGEEK